MEESNVPNPSENVEETTPAVSEVQTEVPAPVENGKIKELEAKIAELSSTIEAKDAEIASLNEAVKTAKQESESSKSSALEEKELKIRELNAKIDELQKEVEKATSEKDEVQADADAARTEVNGLKSQVNQLEGQIMEMRSSTGNVKDLEEEIKVLRILASTESQALDMYNILKEYQSMNLRKLSMQSGMSSQAALSVLQGLEKNGLVKFERAGADDTDPKISLAS